jgi:hypothetical protein
MDIYNGYYIVQDGPRYYTAMTLACEPAHGDKGCHIMIVSGPFASYAEADAKRRGENV